MSVRVRDGDAAAVTTPPDPASPESAAPAVRSVVATAASIVSVLEHRLSDVAERTQHTLMSEVPELRDDARLLELLPETVVANIATVFTSIRNNITDSNVEPPPVALEYARRLAQRDISAYVLVRAYRIGHQAVLDILINEIRGRDLDTQTALDVAEWITDVTFRYIDGISLHVIATYHEERDRWQASRNYVRATHVRDLLAGGDVDVDAITKAIHYPLRRIHMALVVWSDASPNGDETVAIERLVHKLARAVGDGGQSLLIPADRLTAWAWIPLTPDATDGAPESIRDVVEDAADTLRVAIGSPLAGPEGFRRSHEQALAARTVAMNGERVIEARDPGVLLASLLREDLETARRWVGEVLGPLASATENDERLRETLRVFLRAGSSFKAAAADLHLHFNTVRYRVERAVLRRGTEIGADRLDVEVALLLCNLLGDAVLIPD